MKKSTLLHLRVPFSFFLLPVFLFAAGLAGSFHWSDFALIFFILHFLLYPASNAYNSYFDKDEESIGGLKKPPPVSSQLYYTALFLDGVALLLGLLISIEFMVMLFVYGMVSKAYSHPAIRLKKMPVTGWLAAGVFQGYFTWLMVYLGLTSLTFTELFVPEIQVPAFLSTLMLFGSYPMTQVYQHAEDHKRGDRTISLILGIKGTFHFTAAFFTFSVALFVWYFLSYFTWLEAILFVGVLAPVLLFFGWWYLQVRKSGSNADYDRTMRLNFLSSLCLNLFFGWLLFG